MSNTQQQNGVIDGKFIDSIDPEDPDYIKNLLRPAQIKEDVHLMDHRKRVSLILQSRAFRDELEYIVRDHMKDKAHPASLIALQQISELAHNASSGVFNNPVDRFSKVSGPVIPVADLRGVDSLNYSKGEKLLRCKLASTYRLVDIYGWSHGIHNTITCRISQEQEHLLTAPFGMLYSEVTASSLLKVDMQGDILDPGSTTLQLNKSSFSLHSAIHAFRPDVKCIIHLRASAAICVSALDCGLLPLTQEAIHCGDTASTEFDGEIKESQKDELARALGPLKRILFLKNHGAVVCGSSVEEAFFLACNFMAACETQIRALPMGEDNLRLIPEDQRSKIKDLYDQSIMEAADKDQPLEKRKWRRGEKEFEALMRHLDAIGYRTGYIFREHIIRRDGKRDRANAEVEIPPSASSFGQYYDEQSSPMKQLLDKHKKEFKTEWLATPNAYKKEEVDELGSANPKKYTKWVSDNPEATQAGIKIDSPNQFAPQGSNPKEFRNRHKELRKDYYTDKLSAGPQSKILEGATWEDVQKLQDGHQPGTTDQVIVMGAASKGIIQRDHQHNAVVYKSYYAPNPFDSMSEDEISKYKSDVEKQPGEEGGDAGADVTDLSPGPDGRLISTEERMQNVRIGHSPHPVRPRVYLETSLDDLTNDSVPLSQRAPLRSGVRETSIDDLCSSQIPGRPDFTSTPAARSEPVQMRQPRGPPPAPPKRGSTSDDPPSPVPADFQRSTSLRQEPPRSPQLVEELQNFNRSKSERYPHKARGAETSQNEEENPHAVSSPAKSTSSTEGQVERDSDRSGKKKKKFRIPSFSTKKERKERK